MPILPSDLTQFPVPIFLNALRKKNTAAPQFIDRIGTQNPNIKWIYQCIRYIANLLSQPFSEQPKQSPQVKIQALKFVKLLLEMCTVPVLNLIEIYLLALLYEFSISKPQDISAKRGHRFFIDCGYSSKTPNIQTHGRQFILLSTELLYVASLIKKYRIYQNKQTTQPSNYTNYYYQYLFYEIAGGPNTLEQLMYFDQNQVIEYRGRYLEYLAKWDQVSQQYTDYFVGEVVRSLETRENRLLSGGNAAMSIDRELDIRRIIRTCDSYVSSPLLERLSEGLKNSQSSIVRYNYLCMLAEMVEWADIEAFLHINYEKTIQQIAIRIAEIQGHLQLQQGQKIYPQISQPAQDKLTLYIKFLQSLQTWSKISELSNSHKKHSHSKIHDFYTYFKDQRKFIFPKNPTIKTVLKQFMKNCEKNKIHNYNVINKCKFDCHGSLEFVKDGNVVRKYSLYQLFKSRRNNTMCMNIEKQGKTGVSMSQLWQQLQQCNQIIATLFDDGRKVLHPKMSHLHNFTNTFTNRLENLSQMPSEQQFASFIEQADLLSLHINALHDNYQLYCKGALTYEQFQEFYMKEFEITDLMVRNQDRIASYDKDEIGNIAQIIGNDNDNRSNIKSLKPNKNSFHHQQQQQQQQQQQISQSYCLSKQSQNKRKKYINKQAPFIKNWVSETKNNSTQSNNNNHDNYYDSIGNEDKFNRQCIGNDEYGVNDSSKIQKRFKTFHECLQPPSSMKIDEISGLKHLFVAQFGMEKGYHHQYGISFAPNRKNQLLAIQRRIQSLKLQNTKIRQQKQRKTVTHSRNRCPTLSKQSSRGIKSNMSDNCQMSTHSVVVPDDTPGHEHYQDKYMLQRGARSDLYDISSHR